MRQHKAAAVAARIPYSVGTVSGVLCTVLAQLPVRDADDSLAYAAAYRNLVVTGALLALLMDLALVFVPMALFPVWRRIDAVLAIGYLTGAAPSRSCASRAESTGRFGVMLCQARATYSSFSPTGAT